MTKKEQYEKAMNILATRRQNAAAQQQKRREEVLRRLPEIAQMERVMSQSVIRLSKLILSKQGDSGEIIPQIMQENLSMQEKIAQLLQEQGYPADYLKCRYTCSRCEDTGFVDGERCSCLTMLLKQIAAEDFNSTVSLRTHRFEDFDLNYYSNDNRNGNGLSDRQVMEQIFRFCENYAKGFRPHSPSILMLGDTGLGKTHLSLAIAEEVIRKGYSVLYGSAQDFFSRIQNEYFGKGKDGADTMQDILQADLLILDDLGAEYESSFSASAFYNIVNGRLNQNRPTIISTNLSVKEIESRYTDRVLSRLMALYQTVKFVGKDIRQQKRQNKKRS
ncbi:MAG: ATP-binding protein [Massiliimalia sp.]|jgi:DNA replication protein DnaC